MKKWNVEISDSVWYPNIEAETEEQAKQTAWEWFISREPKIIATLANEE